MINNLIGYKDSHSDSKANDFSKKFMTSLEISEVTGRRHDNILRDIRKLLSKGVQAHNFEESFYKQSLPNGASKDVPCYKLTQKGCLILASGYNPLLREKIIDRWESLETGQAAPMYQVNTTAMTQVLPLKEQMAWVKEVSKVLKLNDSSTLSMYQQIAQPYGNQLPLPKYTDSKGVLKSASELLHERGIDMSAKKFNLTMLDRGYLTENTRKSSKGEKKFKTLTAKGLNYGENQVNPQNPRETQPLYYTGKFDKLLKDLEDDVYTVDRL